MVGMNLPLSTAPEDGSVEGSTGDSVDPGLEAAFHLQVDLSERGLVTGHDIRVIKCDGGDLGQLSSPRRPAAAPPHRPATLPSLPRFALDETQRKSEYSGRKRVTGETVLAAIRNGFSVVVRSAHFRSSICASLTHALEDDLGELGLGLLGRRYGSRLMMGSRYELSYIWTLTPPKAPWCCCSYVSNRAQLVNTPYSTFTTHPSQTNHHRSLLSPQP